MWANRAAQLGYKWQVGNGNNISFWEDHWFGNSNLAIQYWPLYMIVNEKNISIAEA